MTAEPEQGAGADRAWTDELRGEMGEPVDQAADESVDIPAGTDLTGPIEAMLLMATEPIAAASLAAALEVPVEEVTAALERLARFYDETGRGFELRHLGGGWRYYTRPEHAETIAAAVLSGQTARLSTAALETLAVIAYQQPVSRSRVAAIRGVSVDGVMRTLLARDLIAEVGNDPDSGAILFGTTEYFLERMGLDSLDDLPELAPHLPEASELEAELLALAQPASETGEAETSDQPSLIDPDPDA